MDGDGEVSLSRGGESLLKQLRRWGRTRLSVEVQYTPPTVFWFGEADRDRRLVRVSPRLPSAVMAAVVAHELAHVVAEEQVDHDDHFIRAWVQMVQRLFGSTALPPGAPWLAWVPFGRVYADLWLAGWLVLHS